MKISRKRLKRIIREEVQKVLEQLPGIGMPLKIGPASAAGKAQKDRESDQAACDKRIRIHLNRVADDLKALSAKLKAAVEVSVDWECRGPHRHLDGRPRPEQTLVPIDIEELDIWIGGGESESALIDHERLAHLIKGLIHTNLPDGAVDDSFHHGLGSLRIKAFEGAVSLVGSPKVKLCAFAHALWQTSVSLRRITGDNARRTSLARECENKIVHRDDHGPLGCPDGKPPRHGAFGHHPVTGCQMYLGPERRLGTSDHRRGT